MLLKLVVIVCLMVVFLGMCLVEGMLMMIFDLFVFFVLRLLIVRLFCVIV